MASPQDSAINFTFTADASQAKDAVKDLNVTIRQAEESAGLLGKALEGFGKIGATAFGIVGAVLKAPIDLSNYIGQLNQKITQVGDHLNRYKDILIQFKSADYFKPGEGGFGLKPDEYDRIMKQFATGTTAIEKYGAASQANLKDYTQGAGMAMKLLGFDPNQATEALTNMHKTFALNFRDMEPFVKQMGNIGKSANLSTDQFYKLTKQVTALAKAYGLSGEAGKKFVTGSLAVGSALSQLGLDASEMMSKMNAVATGSEQGLITSLLLGFKPGDTQGQLEAFQRQAKEIVAMAQSAGPQMAPYIMQQLGSVYGMNMNPEQMMRLAQGLPATEGGAKKDATDILKDILADQQNPDRAAEKPFVTAAQTGNAILSAIQSLLAKEFWGALQDLQRFIHTNLGPTMTKIEGWLNTLKDWVGKFDSFFGFQTTALGTLVKAALGLATIPVALKFTGGLLEGIGKSLAIRMLGGATGSAGSALVSGAGMLTAVGAASIAAVAGTIIVGTGFGLLMGTLIRKYVLSRETNESIGDIVLKFLDPTGNLTGTQASRSRANLDKNAALAENLMTSHATLAERSNAARMATKGFASSHAPSNITAASSHGATSRSYSYDLSGMEALGKDKGLRLSPGTTDPSQHEPGSLHGQGLAADFGMADKTYAESLRIASEIEAEGFKVKNEYYKPKGEGKWTGPHLHVSAPGGVASSMAQANTGAATSPGLQAVHDSASNSTLTSIRDLLSQVLSGHVAAGAPSYDSTGEDAKDHFAGGASWARQQARGY